MWSPVGLALLTAGLVVFWLGAVFLIDPIRFVVFNPRGKTGFEMFLALGQLFGALVLAISPGTPGRERLSWVAMGFLILGLGALGFGYLLPSLDVALHHNVNTYGSLVVRTVATALVATGLVLRHVPRLTRPMVVALLVAVVSISILLVLQGHRLPVLLSEPEWKRMLDTSIGQGYPGMTRWRLVCGGVPLVLGVAAAWAAVRHASQQAFGSWLVIAVVLLAGAQLHSLFWPSLYSSVLTTTSVLRLCLTAVVVTGGIFELRALALERARLLADEQERVQQLQDLNMLKRDFSSMVAHELATPLAAIQNLAGMIGTGVLPAEQQGQAASRIEAEAHILQLLVKDIQASSDVEREDFAIRSRPVSLRALLDDARNYATTIQRNHPLTVEAPDDVTVLGDPDRLGQVIRNLLNNAIRHTPGGTPITLRAWRDCGRVRIEVEDAGPGIDPADREVIMEKFGRGHSPQGAGRGLGLYLSRRILWAHGSDLEVESAPGQGARFSFCLEEHG